MKNKNYEILSTGKISEKRNIVISSCEKDGNESGFTVAQQIEIQEGKKDTRIFLKNAIHVENIDGLYNIRDAVNEAIDKIESQK